MNTGEEKNANIDVEEIMEKIESYFGFVPKIFQVISDNPPFLKAYLEKSEALMLDESLDPLTKELVSIGAAAALGSTHCLSTHLNVAKDFGATEKQLLLAVTLGASITETTALSKSLRVYEDFKK